MASKVPTIIIGLGGTGIHILSEIRTALRQDDLTAQSIDKLFQFVSIDTNEFIGNEVGPTVNIGLSARNLIARKCVERNDPDFLEWWDCKWLNFFPETHFDATGGCRAVRRLGRLCFYSDFMLPFNSRIKRSLEHAKEEALYWGDHSPNDDSLLIVVCTSLCGGTGSGMFLDLAYYIRKKFANTVSSFGLLGIFFLPELYEPTLESQSNMHVLRANAYAAIKEIQYFSNSGYKFDLGSEKISFDGVEAFDAYWFIGREESQEQRIYNIKYGLYFVAQNLVNRLKQQPAFSALGVAFPSQAILSPLSSSQISSWRNWESAYQAIKQRTGESPHISKELDQDAG